MSRGRLGTLLSPWKMLGAYEWCPTEKEARGQILSPGMSCLHRSSENTRSRFRLASLSTMPLSISLVPILLLLPRLAASAVVCPGPDANAHKRHQYLQPGACSRSEGEVPQHISLDSCWPIGPHGAAIGLVSRKLLVLPLPSPQALQSLYSHENLLMCLNREGNYLLENPPATQGFGPGRMPGWAGYVWAGEQHIPRWTCGCNSEA